MHHQTEIQSRATHWPRARNMPLWSLCSTSMVAQEASALQPDGGVSYLWGCDSCGHGFVTYAAVRRKDRRNDRENRAACAGGDSSETQEAQRRIGGDDPP